ncbi:MAG: polyisoprenoid-binding protein, partial [Methanobacteriota archaeon]
MLIVILLFSLNLMAADRFEIDPVHSSIDFYVKHMVISTVPGEFREFSGVIYYDPNDITQMRAEVTIKTPSIFTDNPKRDKHLKSPDFFDVEKYPTITFVSKRVEKKGDGYVMVGDLTMHGVTKEVEIPFQVNGTIVDWKGNTRLGMEGTLTLNRQDYGVSWSKTLDNGGLVVS